MLEQNTPAQPNIITSPGLKNRVVDPMAVGQIMVDLQMSQDLIERTSIYVDDSNRLATNGIAYPKWLGRIRHFTKPQLRTAEGPFVRISSVVKGFERSADDMNITLVHELEHVAQMGRHDPKIRLGQLAIWGLALTGGIAANRLATGHSKVGQAAATVVGVAMGQQIGYRIAPHEVQARDRSHAVRMTAITRR